MTFGMDRRLDPTWTAGKNQKNRLLLNFLFTVRYPAKLLTLAAPGSSPTRLSFLAESNKVIR